MTITRFGHPWVDESEFPILQTTYPVPLHDDELAAYIAHLDKWIAAATEPYAWIVRPFSGSAKHRKMIAESRNRRSPYEKTYCAGYAFVAESAALRGVVTAVFWLSPSSPTGSYEIFSEHKAALAWAKARLAKMRNSYL